MPDINQATLCLFSPKSNYNICKRCIKNKSFPVRADYSDIEAQQRSHRDFSHSFSLGVGTVMEFDVSLLLKQSETVVF